MGNIFTYISAGIVIGCIIGWLAAKARMAKHIESAKQESESRCSTVEREHIAYKAATEITIKNYLDSLADRQNKLAGLESKIEQHNIRESELVKENSSLSARLDASGKIINEKLEEIKTIKSEREQLRNALTEHTHSLASEKANNAALEEKLQSQKDEIETLGKKFNLEFENIANKILESKTEKFTELNKSNLTAILEPLGKNITEFKSKVDEVYDKESKERFSLGKEVRELSNLNKLISEEARNLTHALKGETKTQGRWGEMILESILERSGLTKGREYHLEHELKDDSGTTLKSDAEGKKMRPDAVVYYPGDRRVIIDSKMSLNAFTRMIEADSPEQQKQELDSHVAAVKNHINTLSTKGYDDYDKSLDFVMMFIASEPAYNAAIQGDPNLWNFAYEKRILLLSPTNLITSLKLISELWKREYQNQNVQAIAERGAKLYDKFVGFIDSLSDVGNYLDKAQKKYDDAYKQLSTGRDNLVTQANKLKQLGVKNKKELAQSLVNTADMELPAPSGQKKLAEEAQA